MSAYAPNQYFQGQGRVYLALRDNTAQPLGFTFLGNAPKVALNLGRHAVQYASGGVQAPRNKHTASTPPTVDIDLESISKENLATAIYGTASAIAGGSISSEPVVMYAGQWSPLSNIGLQSIASIKSFDSLTIYIDGVDYNANLNTGSIQAIAGGRISTGQIVLVSYTFTGYDKVGGFTTASPVVWVRFEGINSVDNNSAPIVVLFVWFPPSLALSL